MSKRQKRLKKLRQNPTNVSFDDLRQVMEDFGAVLDRVAGSHYVFELTERQITLVIPYRNPVKLAYVKKVIELIDLLQSTMPDQEETDEGAEEDHE